MIMVATRKSDSESLIVSIRVSDMMSALAKRRRGGNGVSTTTRSRLGHIDRTVLQVLARPTRHRVVELTALACFVETLKHIAHQGISDKRLCALSTTSGSNATDFRKVLSIWTPVRTVTAATSPDSLFLIS